MSTSMLTRLGHLALAIVLVSLVAGQVLGYPILLGYVTSDSMEPTINAGDGFVAIPEPLAGDVGVGDVVVYESPDGDGLVTHRIVDETEAGYVTRGDGNPVTDQESGDPPLADDAVLATALQARGEVITIPSLGAVATTAGAAAVTAQTWLTDVLEFDQFQNASILPSVVLVLSVAGYLFETVRERSSRRTPSADVEPDPRRLALAFALFVVVVASAAMVVPAGSQTYTVVSSDPAPDADLVVEPGENADTTYRVANSGFTPVVAYLEPADDGVSVTPDSATVPGRDSEHASVTLDIPETTGHHDRTVVEWRYLYVFPRDVIDALYGWSPWVPFGAIVTTLGGLAYVTGRVVAGSPDVRALRNRTRQRSLSKSTRRR
ncbi:signal peptidase I [Natrarchaeobaculum aegyptiacum]|uniref:Signal peptidase I n=1 Tax=Natrarchaeobaculum aegyptiacum TaxID=745377 RepID=A0A2Z2HW70_9EURY|nr:signal peptidase I [Natrarchaeobaculum aegyptiacum]ARS91470.1 signal peptidase I [Natrarchaeobaculum aegyptiacum]